MIIEKISARVFCQLQGGGNPVTLFVANTGLKAAVASRLAQTCAWESVMVHRNSASGSSSSHEPSMEFFLPTGLSVSFCAHAAIGGAYALSTKPEESIRFSTQHGSHQAVVHTDDIVSLQMKSPYVETPVTSGPLLHRVLRQQLNVDGASLRQGVGHWLHASVARPKTLVRLNTVEALHEVQPPLDAARFQAACDALDDSTGLYLYTLAEQGTPAEVVMHARQFPRASGYPEDPATGIAAAALAAAWHRRDTRGIRYKIHQGEAMGQASLIVVQDIEFDKNVEDNADSDQHPTVSFGLLGRIEVDSREEIHLDDEDIVPEQEIPR